MRTAKAPARCISALPRSAREWALLHDAGSSRAKLEQHTEVPRRPHEVILSRVLLILLQTPIRPDLVIIPVGANPFRRACLACSRNVFFCGSVDKGYRRRRLRGDLIALDPSAANVR